MLVLLSSGTRKQTEEIDGIWREEVPRGARITYIPSSITPLSEQFFRDFKKYYGYYGFKKIKTFLHEKSYSPQLLKEALASEIIYLSGGNTFYFVDSLRRGTAWASLKKIVHANSKVVIGLSAGAIMLTPNIFTASLGPIADRNEVKLTDLRGLGGTSFYFSPHFDGSAKTLRTLERVRGNKSLPTMWCPDGSGIVVANRGKDQLMQIVGNVLCAGGNHHAKDRI